MYEFIKKNAEEETVEAYNINGDCSGGSVELAW